MSWDTVVLGLGGMGSAALAHVASRGKRVIGLERFQPLHGFGSSHGNSRIIRQTYFLDGRYVTLVQRAYELWRELEAETGEALLNITGGLFVSTRDNTIVDGGLQSAREHGLAHELLERDEVARRYPSMHFREGEVALFEPTAGFLRPEACIGAHLRRAIESGAQARFGTSATRYEATANGVRVWTSDGEVIDADRLIVTAGAWLGGIAADLGLPLVVERQVMHWFAPAGTQNTDALESLPIFIVARKDGRVYGFPYVAGEGIKIAFYRSFQPTDPDDVGREVRPEEVLPIRAFLDGLIPGAAATYLRSKVCLYTLTPDEHFVIGLHPAQSNVVIAGGFSGHGFKFCSVVGEIVADLALEGRTRHSIGFLSPDRFAGVASPT
ncbi:MAG TPA: N-methyl-L-tryptophan oxidase [Candidatus Baltobacteraceae bacterium]|jgi:sarcosine oxidase